METMVPLAVLYFAAALLVKHVICDGPLQTLAMVQAKRFYGRPLGLFHAAIHLAGTFTVGLVFGIDLKLALLLAVIDGVVHYHVDFTKENIVKAMGWTTSGGPFWWALTTDQAAHQLTYLFLSYLAFTR